MDFREFYKKFAAEQIDEAKKKKPDADGDGVPDWADKKPGEDDHAEKKDKKKKSLKDWFEQVDKEMIAEQQVMPGIKQNLEIKTGSAPATRITDPQSGTTIVTSEPSVVAAAKTGKLTLDKQLKEKESKDKPNLKHLKRQYKDNESSNAHTENAVLLATHFGDDTEVAQARAALKHRDQRGGYDSGDKEAKKHLQRLHKIHTKYGHKLSEEVIEEAEKWIQKAIKKPGALKKQLGVPSDEKIPAGKLAAAAKKGGKLGQRARLAQTLKSINKEGHEESLDEKITKKTPAGEIISDFEKSKNVKFKGKSKQKRKEMALGAYYGMHPEKSKKKTNEADQPLDGDQLGPGSKSARNKYVLEKTQVTEAMDTRKIAYHEGKAMGLQHKHACKYNEGSEEHKSFHEGFMKGIDECYNSGVKNMPIVGMEEDSMPPATVPGMASAAMPAMPTMEADLDEMNKSEYMKHKAQSTPGDTFKAFGQTMHDKDVLEADAFAFESLDKQLNSLLNESSEPVVEGLSVSMSTGQQGAADSVSVTGTDDEAGKLLAFIKQVGLGGMGGEEPKAEVVSVTGSDYGGPSFQGYENSDMAKLLQKVGVDDHEEDFKDEAGHTEDHGEPCNECGMHEAKCACEKSVEETQTPDQLEADSISEDDGEGYTASQADAGKIDSALALSGASKGGAMNEGGDGMEDEEENVTEAKKHKKKESTAEKDDKAEKAAKKVAKDIEYDEGHKGKDDDKAEKAGEKVKKDIEYDDKKDKKKKVDEWANDAGKDSLDAAFEQDIEFMMNIISGGLNKRKSTGQQTIPVLAGDETRTNINEDIQSVKKLAGLK